MFAVTNGHFDFMKLLIEAGADTDIKNKYGDTVFNTLEKRYPQTYGRLVRSIRKKTLER